ncbi:unnamed protein product, partial [Sphacelaria rigidula]
RCSLSQRPCRSPSCPLLLSLPSIEGSAASGACLGNRSMRSIIEGSIAGEVAFRSVSNHSFHHCRIACLPRNSSPVALLMKVESHCFFPSTSKGLMCWCSPARSFLRTKSASSNHSNALS